MVTYRDCVNLSYDADSDEKKQSADYSGHGKGNGNALKQSQLQLVASSSSIPEHSMDTAGHVGLKRENEQQYQDKFINKATLVEGGDAPLVHPIISLLVEDGQIGEDTSPYSTKGVIKSIGHVESAEEQQQHHHHQGKFMEKATLKKNGDIPLVHPIMSLLFDFEDVFGSGSDSKASNPNANAGKDTADSFMATTATSGGHHSKGHLSSSGNKDEEQKKKRANPSGDSLCGKVMKKGRCSIELDLSGVPSDLKPILKAPNPKVSFSSKYRGVTLYRNCSKPWKAEIWIDEKQRLIGSYDNERDAAIDYARALFKYRGQEAYDEARSGGK